MSEWVLIIFLVSGRYEAVSAPRAECEALEYSINIDRLPVAVELDDGRIIRGEHAICGHRSRFSADNNQEGRK